MFRGLGFRRLGVFAGTQPKPMLKKGFRGFGFRVLGLRAFEVEGALRLGP